MSDTGRDSRNSPAIIGAKEFVPSDAGVAVAAGTFPPRMVGLRKPVTLDHEQRRGLVALIAAGKMLRRSDGYFSLQTGDALSIDVGRFLKRHDFAVAGFNNDMVATRRGKMIAQEIKEDHKRS